MDVLLAIIAYNISIMYMLSKYFPYLLTLIIFVCVLMNPEYCTFFSSERKCNSLLRVNE